MVKLPCSVFMTLRNIFQLNTLMNYTLCQSYESISRAKYNSIKMQSIISQCCSIKDETNLHTTPAFPYCQHIRHSRPLLVGPLFCRGARLHRVAPLHLYQIFQI